MATNTDYPTLRQNLGQQYAAIPDARLAAMLSGRGIEAEAMEGFLSDMGGFLAKAAPTVLPIAGKVVGSIYGGPAGAAIGGQLGSLAGGAISNLAGGGRPQGGASGSASGGGGAPSGGAAGQLLQTITRPETLQALASMAMGALGKQNVSVGGTSVPVSAFSNLLGTLAGRAEAEYNSELAQNAGAMPGYLLDYSGQPKVDPANPAARAEALYELLGEAAAEAGEGEAAEGEAAEAAEAYEAASEWESEADAIEMLELAEAEWEEA
jgi:hypothetical protein